MASLRGNKVRMADVLAPRSLFIKVSPVPASFAERRAALQAIKKHVAVEVFKKLPHNPASFISVMESETDAQRLVELSPLSYEVTRTITQSPLTPSPTVMPTTPDHVIKRHTSSGIPLPQKSTALPNESRRQFTVHIFPSPQYDHLSTISRSRYYGSWPAHHYRKGSVIEMLKATIPLNIRQEGLATWDRLDAEMEEPQDVTVKMIWEGREKDRNDAFELPGCARGLWRTLRESQKRPLQTPSDVPETPQDPGPDEIWLSEKDRPIPSEWEENSNYRPTRTIERAVKYATTKYSQTVQPRFSGHITPETPAQHDGGVTTSAGENGRTHAVDPEMYLRGTEREVEDATFWTQVVEDNEKREMVDKLRGESSEESRHAVQEAKEKEG